MKAEVLLQKLAKALDEKYTFLFGINHHAAELIDIERPSAQSYTLLLEDGGTAVLTFYGDIADEEERREYNQTNERCKQVLHVFTPTFLRI